MKGFIVLILMVLQSISSALPSEIYEDDLEEKSIVQSIIQHENEVTSREDQKHLPRTPQYPIQILKQFDLNSMPSGNQQKPGGSSSSITLKINDKRYTKPKSRLFHVWLPVEILEANNVNQTQVRFQQTLSRDYFGDFTSSQITLTLRDDVQLSLTTYLKIYTNWQNDALQSESIQTKHIVNGKKFHSFDITEFMESSLKQYLPKPNFINIGFQVYDAYSTNPTNLGFKRIFDIQVDRPLIMFFYDGFIPAEIDPRSMRKRRFTENATTGNRPPRPTSQCQRRSFTVKPEQVDWTNLVEPKELDLGYCSGSCPYPLADNYYNFTLHRFLLDRYRLNHALSVPNDLPYSKCVPITYQPISVLETVGADGIEAGVVDKVSVGSCGCR